MLLKWVIAYNLDIISCKFVSERPHKPINNWCEIREIHYHIQFLAYCWPKFTTGTRKRPLTDKFGKNYFITGNNEKLNVRNPSGF